MTVDDGPVRDMLAALSFYAGRSLPQHLTDLARLHHYRPHETENGYRSRLLKALGKGERAAALLTLGRSLRERADEAGIALLIRGDTGWPAYAHLGRVPCLWVRGNPDLLGALSAAVTVTGTRAATDEGRFLAAEIAGGLADAGMTVVAGLSVGIDATAAAAAFTSTTPPILVDAGGLDQPVGISLRNLADRTATTSTLVSLFPPGSGRSARRRDGRDWLLGLLSAATVVVEAPARPHGILAARAAVGAGRLLCAVPGPPGAGTWAGGRQLIADRAALPVTTSGSVLAALRDAAGQGRPAAVAAVNAKNTPETHLNPAEPTP